MIALLVAAAAAYAVDIKICSKITTDFVDAAPDITVSDDYLNDNDVERAFAGIYMEASDNGPGADFAGYAEDDGPDRGCVTFPLVTGNTYTLKIWSKTKVGDNHTVVAHTSTGFVIGVAWNTTYTAPTTAETVTHVRNGGRMWSALAVSTWALFHHDAGLANETWNLYDDNCQTGIGYCIECDPDLDGNEAVECGGTDNEEARIHVGSSSRNVVIHELGHLLAVKAAYAGGYNDPAADAEACHEVGGGNSGHHYQSKEYTAEALWEGFASSYPAVTFNDVNGGDCFVHYYKNSDWDVNGFSDSLAYQPVNCDDEPKSGLDVCVTDFDYLDDSNNGCGCGTGSLFNRATEYDMVRFVWRAFEDTRFTFADIVGVLATAWANGFDGTSDDPADYQPADAVRDAAADYFSLNPDDESAWNAHAGDNGLYH